MSIVGREEAEEAVPFTAAFPPGGERQAAWFETVVVTLVDLLRETLVRTRRRVEKRQALTAEELELERELEEKAARGEALGEEDDDATGADDSEDEEEALRRKFRGKKNVVLGWDGKPIPYWLYRVRREAGVVECARGSLRRSFVARSSFVAS